MELLDQLSLMNNTKRKIVCPMPLVWWDLRTLICRKSYPDTFRGIKINSKLGKRLAAGFKDEILYPLILAGWSASDENKRERFLGHIKIAEKKMSTKPEPAYVNQKITALLKLKQYSRAENALQDFEALKPYNDYAKQNIQRIKKQIEEEKNR